MFERLVRFAGIFFVFLIFAVPAMVPEIAIALALIVWPIVYLVVWLFSIGHSLTADLPWTVFEPGSIVLGGILFSAFINICIILYYTIYKIFLSIYKYFNLIQKYFNTKT